MKRIRVLLADDHTLVVEGLRKLLAPHFDLVETVEDGRELLRKAPLVKPDVVLLDISMPLLNGIDAARRLHRLLPETKIVFLTMHDDPAYVTEAFRAGASGYVLKRSAASELVRAVHEVINGGSWVTPVPAEHAPRVVPGGRGSRGAAPGDLTARQREVLQLLAEGHASKEMAEILNVSLKTVEYHKARLMERLGLHTTAELTRYAVHHGLVC